MQSTRCITTRQLVYEKYGNPPDMLKITTSELPKLGTEEVRVRWLGAPINPADINQVQGVYPIKPPLPAVGGIEGFGEIEEIGSGIKALHVGDWVVPSNSHVGCWRTHGNHLVSDLYQIKRGLPFESAATFQVNPPTAYRMLKDFVKLKPGDLVVQNGANSNVGRVAIQLCKAWGVRTVNVVRNRPNLAELVQELKELGADEVFTEEDMKKECKDRAKNAQLALNCVGGKSAMYLVNCLAPKGVMVTYGGMSKQHIQTPTGPLIFKDIKLVGFMVTRWYTITEYDKDREDMFSELADLMKQGKLRPPTVNKIKLDDWKEAVNKTMTGSGVKQLFVLQ